MLEAAETIWRNSVVTSGNDTVNRVNTRIANIESNKPCSPSSWISINRDNDEQ